MIYINNLIKKIGTRILFKIDSLSIAQSDRIGLIGDNGVGKTTFFKILLGIDRDFSGSVDVNMDLNFLLCDESDFCDSLSPGEYQKKKLIKLLLNEGDFLLVDEPTSHLDIDKKEQVVDAFRNRKNGFIVISHDRDFINRTCSKIFELVNEKIEVYNGNYSIYLDELVRRDKFIKREYDAYVNEKKRLEKLLNDVKIRSSKIRTTPKRMGNSEARLHKMGGQGNKKKLDKEAKAIESRIRQLDVFEKPREKEEIKLSISEKDKIFSKVLISADKLYKSFGERKVFKDASFKIFNDKKIALLGENGSGKTTLLKMILDRSVWVHPNVKIGYYSQLGEILDLDKSVISNVMDCSIYDETINRITLARLGFKDRDVYKSVGVLSDGERAKVKLAKLLVADFNFLILDEPTNYLDIHAIEALEELLRGYDRPILFVTHDISFINHLADEMLIIKDKKIESFEGNLNDYKKRKEESKMKKNSDDFLIDFRISAINNRLTLNISESERKELEDEYKRLVKMKNK